MADNVFYNDKVPEAEFEGQTKNRLGNPEVILQTATDLPALAYASVIIIMCPSMCLSHTLFH